jgi:hypothetical protein
VTRPVDHVVEAGLAVRENSPSDRRSIHVMLTPTGYEVLERAIAAHVESIDHHLTMPLNDDDRATLNCGADQDRWSDRSEDNRNRIHNNMGNAGAPGRPPGAGSVEVDGGCRHACPSRSSQDS